MNCNHHNNNTDVAQIPHVYGNVLRLAIPLTLRTLTLDGGKVKHTDEPFYPSSEYPVEVVLSKGATKVRIAAEMDGNVASIEDEGTIPIGVFSITVSCRDDKGRPYRFKKNSVLNVVDTTREAGIEPTIEYEAATWYLDAAIFLATGGGVSVQSDWSEEDTESGAYIRNKPTIPVVPTNVSAFVNDAGYLTEHQDISGKVDKETGKGLSSEDFTSAEKTKLAGLENYDDTALAGRVSTLERKEFVETDPTVPQWAKQPSKPSYTAREVGALPDTTEIPSKTSDLVNDSGFLTQHQSLTNYYTKTQVDELVLVDVVTVATSGAVSQALQPNTFYKFTGALTSLTLTLTAGTGLVVYAGKFTASSSGCTLSLPATVTEAASNDTIEGGKTYEFSIVDNVIVIKEV